MVAGAKGGERAVRYLAELNRRMGDGDQTAVNVGFFADATYPDGTPVAMVALWQNFGTSEIPPRPFFSNMIEQKQGEWGPALGMALKDTNYDVGRALDRVGEGMTGQLVQSIKDTNDPPLAPDTLRARGVDPDMEFNPKDPKTYGAKPLVRTKVLINSPRYEVTKIGRK